MKQNVNFGPKVPNLHCMTNTDKPKKQVCILPRNCYASNYLTHSLHWLFLRYSVTRLFFFYSSQSKQEMSLSFPAHQPWQFNVVNRISDKVIKSQPIAFKLSFKNSTFSTLSGFNRVLSPFALGTLNSRSLATEIASALRYFQSIVAISGYLWRCPIYTCNGQTLLLHFGTFKYVASSSFDIWFFF